jgi:peptidoglycan/LPS O-acetylase OafA/YrhL
MMSSTAAVHDVEAPSDGPSPAVAPPPGNPRFALFDSLRGLAAIAILTFHVFSLTGAMDKPVVGDTVAVLGPRSLILFFVISGFLLYRPYVAARADGRPGPRMSRYLRRRALRIIPAYWLALTVLAITPASSESSARTGGVTTSSFSSTRRRLSAAASP